MATFANQSSNLSALSSAFASYSDVLDVSDDVILRLTRDEHQRQAERFFGNQKRRISSIDECLLEATENILPPCAEAKTLTELSELCRLVQEATRQKMALLRTRLELLGVKPSWQDSITSPEAAFMDNGTNQIHWSVGGPLDCVIEADVETEGATTPGSLLQPSPFASTTKRKASLTPTTPTMKTFSFSSETASIIGKMDLPSSQTKAKTPGKGLLKTTPSPSNSSRRSERQLNFEGFRDEDDMISINTMEQQSRASQNMALSPLQELREERSQFLARMESMLERVEEELLPESRPSDETNGLSRQGSKEPSMERPSNSKFLEELHADEDSGDDDSTNVIATLVADKPQPVGNKIMRPVPIVRRPSHIVVDTGLLPSPSHTNITMDGTLMNDTMISMSVLQDDDNDSTVTPVLDRYRLDPDDNSIGIKVVPNKRGQHLQRIPESGPTQRDLNTSAFNDENDGFLSPKGLPGTVSARKNKQYRKTPFPKKDHDHTFDEENHPNRGTLSFSPSPSSTSSFDASNPESSFSVPPLRPRSLGPSRTSSRTFTTPGVQSVSILSKTPVVQNVEGNARRESFHKKHEWMEEITKAEYNKAPKIVRVNVTRDEANQAIAILSKLLTSKHQTSQILEFSASEAYEQLSQVVPSEVKCKTVLVGLCHWMRLLYREDGDETMFVVNRFE